MQFEVSLNDFENAVETALVHSQERFAFYEREVERLKAIEPEEDDDSKAIVSSSSTTANYYRMPTPHDMWNIEMIRAKDGVKRHKAYIEEDEKLLRAIELQRHVGKFTISLDHYDLDKFKMLEPAS